MIRGNCAPFAGSLRSAGRWTKRPDGLMSSTGTASSNSNVLTRVNTRAFILMRNPAVRTSLTDRNGWMNHTYSTREKRYPMHARGPPLKVSRWLQTPGMLEISSGGCSHLSGLDAGTRRRVR